jgi:peptidoglycan/xylan/chitin deacetylase (PgdA/CDA1 family)
MKRLLILAALAFVLPTAPHAEDNTADCKDKLGVSRVVEIDTKGGGLYGDQYPPQHMLKKGEVVLTFDDGPHPKYTQKILAALKAQCTKATFFNVGEMVKQYPDVAREVQAEGHTIGTHTWSHPNLGRMSLARAKRQIERTIATENAILPKGVAPFFRFPYLSDPKRVRKYLAGRNIAVFGTDVDSEDYRTHKPSRITDNVLKGLIKTGGGIILFHDIHPQTVKALPNVLAELKRHGYHVVHFVPKSHVQVVAVADPEPKAKPRPHRSRHHHRRRHAPH